MGSPTVTNTLAIIALSRIADLWESHPDNPYLSRDWKLGAADARHSCAQELREVIKAMAQEGDEPRKGDEQ